MVFELFFLIGKVCVVIGVFRGIGKGIVLMLVKVGVIVYIIGK